MNHTPSAMVGYLLRQAGFGSLPGSGVWPVFETTLPDGDSVADDAAGVIDTAGVKQGRLMRGEVIIKHGVQVLVRSRVHKDGWQKADLASRLLSLIQNYPIVLDDDNYTIQSFTQTGDIIKMGQEPEGRRRWMFSINFLVSIKTKYETLFDPEVVELLKLNNYNQEIIFNSVEEFYELVNQTLTT